MTEGPTPLILDVTATPDGPTVTVTGELDMASVERFVEFTTRQLEGPPRQLSVDLSGVRFCDSSGINGLVQLRNLSSAAGWQYRLIRLPSELDRVISDLTGLRDFLNVVED